MIKPIYIFSGFLESGKTSAIITTLSDTNFNIDTKNLIIALEDGIVSYSEKFQEENNATVIYLNEKLTAKYLQEVSKEYDRIIIEANGSYKLEELLIDIDSPDFQVVEILAFFNTETFKLHLNNLKPFIYDVVKYSDVVVFNRYNKQDKKYLRNNIKAINPNITIIYENQNKEVEKDTPEDIFNLEDDNLTINDTDFGLWYMDSLDNPYKYENKKININVKLLEKIPNYENVGLFGREAMVCCADDISKIGIICLGINLENIKPNTYYNISGTIHLLQDSNQKDRAVLYVDEIKDGTLPESELVNFI